MSEPSNSSSRERPTRYDPPPSREEARYARDFASQGAERAEWGEASEGARQSATAEGDASTAELGKREPGVSWPEPPAPEAYYGVAGDIVGAIEPHSEADPVALLVQILVGFGNVVGRGPHFVAEGDRHYVNMNAGMVGATSKGRKGSSWGQVRRLLERVDPDWCRDRIMGGLSSGEGLIWAVRDPIIQRQPLRDRGRVVTGYQDVETDAGVADKRLLIFESELAGPLRVMGRDGNQLSPILRQAWDSGNLRIMTKNSPAKATGAHISLIAHITYDELRRYLDATEQGNGFANRFLWLCVRRSKFLPDDADRQIDENVIGVLSDKLRKAVEFARRVGEMKRDAEAQADWSTVYRALSSGRLGLLGAVTSRAEAQTMRLACIYALLDCSDVVKREHLEAALALWSYCERSAKFIFGDATGDPVADAILEKLRSEPLGLTRSEIYDVLGRHQSRERIARSLTSLAQVGLARFEKGDSGGRPLERWFAL